MRVNAENIELKDLQLVLAELQQEYQDVCDPRIREEDEVLISQLSRLAIDFFFVYNFRNNQIFQAHGIADKLGFEPEELTSEFLYKLTHPDDLASLIKIEKKMLRCALTLRNGSAKKANLFTSYRIRNKNGNYIKVNRQSSYFQQDNSGRPISILHLFTDVSDLITDSEVSYALDYPGYRNQINITKKELPITRRELEILKLISKGKSSNDIGKELYISNETVNRHRKNMIRKTGMQDTYRLALRAIQENWI